MNRIPLFIAAIGLVILIGLFVLLRPNTASPSQENPQPSQAMTSPTPSEKIFELRIEDNELTSGPETITVKEGETVVINITSDEDDEFHLHGYNRSVALEKGITSEVQFVADQTGRFPYELHETGLELGALEVMPK